MDVELMHGFHLGDMLIEPVTGRVIGPSSSGRLAPKAMEVLLCLASDPGELVLRETLLEKVWGPGNGSHAALSHAVRDIRHALADDVGERRFIQTVPRRGYRLIEVPRPVTTEANASGNGTAAKERGAVGPLEEFAGLFEDLKRRGVIKTGAFYIVAGWVIIQAADVLVERLMLRPWIATFVTLLVIAGFPIALCLSWFLDLRDGRSAPNPRTPAELRRRHVTRTYLPALAGLSLAAVLVFLYDREFGLPESAESPVAPDQSRYLPSVLDNSIAVLRFMNVDGSERTQVFSDGLADDLITRLSQVPGLFVSSRGDSFTLEPNTGTARVRERLRVSYYVEGSVQIEGDAIRVVMQLIDSTTGYHVLSRKFDRPLTDFFAMRDEISELAVANVRVAFPEGTDSLSVPESEVSDLDAYVAYRRGKEIIERPRTLESIADAIGHYQQALGIDPRYAAAHAGLCDAHVARYELSNTAEDIRSAEAACATALATSPRLFMVHASLGDLYRRTGRPDEAERAYKDALSMNPNEVRAMTGLAGIFALRQQPTAAEQLFQKAIATQPGNWRTINGYGTFLFSLGRYPAAADAFRQVVALDPDNYQARTNAGAALTMAGDFQAGKELYEESLQISEFRTAYSNLGVVYYYLGDFEKSVETHRKAIELSPDEAMKWVNLADSLHFAGEAEEATEAFRRTAELAQARIAIDATDFDTMFLYAWSLQMLGEPDAARRALQQGLAIAPNDPYGLYYAGLIAARNGDRESALASLRLAVEHGYPPRMLAAEPYLSELRAEPAFVALVSGSG